MFKKVLAVGCCFLTALIAEAQPEQKWVDSVMQTLSLEEKIGQLFMPEWSGSLEESDELTRTSRAFNVGAIAVNGGTAPAVARTLQKIQQNAKVPLLVSLRADWGAGQSLDSSLLFPPPLLACAAGNDSIIYSYGKLLATQLRSSGISINLLSRATPRSFLDRDSLYYSWGADVASVSRRLQVFRRGLEDNGALMCIENFPIELLQPDSIASPTIYPALLRQQVSGIIPTAQRIPVSLEQKAKFDRLQIFPPRLSAIVTNTQVEKTLKYQGLLFVRIPELKTTTGKIRPGEPELFAFQTGNDLLIGSKNIGLAIRKIKKSVKREKVYQQQLDNSVRKILRAKHQSVAQPATATFSKNDLDQLASQIRQNAVTVIANTKNQLPIQVLDNTTFASVSIGISSDNAFNKYLAHYAAVDEYCAALPQDSSVFQQLAGYNTIIAGVFPFADNWLPLAVRQLQKLSRTSNVIVVYFGHPSSIPAFAYFDHAIAAYTADPAMIRTVAQQIFGALPMTGSLPVTFPFIPTPAYQKTSALGRLSEGLPEEVGMSSTVLGKIRDIAYEAIDTGATPGCRVLVARKGKIIYDRSFGWLTYENQIPVTAETIYDLASVTKVSATLQAVAFLHEKRLIDVNKKISVYLSELKRTNKEDFTIKDILTHQAGLWPFLPFWADTMKDSVHLPQFYASNRSTTFPFDVSQNLYAVTSMKDSLWQWIIRSKVREKPARTPYDYRYSDMGFYMLQHLAEKLLNQPMEDFLAQNFYDPLGAYTLGYLPLTRFPSDRIAPTENDKLFRKSLLTGYVHDQGAAMHGGVAGHAGLFGTAYDLAKLGQLWLNNGTYAGIKYFNPETVRYFTEKQYQPSRRGLGWDKRDFVNESISPTSRFASARTFGHTGFTGTCIWVDPAYDLVYVFLSNRVHPEMANNKLLSLNIRTRIHDVVYQAITDKPVPAAE